MPACDSLKAKRAVVRSLRDQLINKHHVSAAEVDFQDRWQKTELWAALVATDRRHAQKVISRLDRLVEAEPRAHVIERESVFY